MTRPEIYHSAYTSAVETALAYARNKGYTLSEDDIWNNISVGPAKPSLGKTNRLTLSLYKKDKECKECLHFQVSRISLEKFELNVYIS